MILKCFLVTKDCGDGTINVNLFGDKQQCLDNLRVTEEELEEENFYETGQITETEIEVDVIDGKLVLLNGFKLNLYQ